MEIGYVTSKGQLVIPSKMRRKFGIKAGTDGIKIIPVTSELIKSNIGFLKGKGDLMKALMEEKKKEREL